MVHSSMYMRNNQSEFQNLYKLQTKIKTRKQKSKTGMRVCDRLLITQFKNKKS